MKLFTQALITIVLATLGLLAVETEVQTSADIVFNNGNIYTVNASQPKAEAVAVKADRIVFVGSNRAAQRYVGQTTRVVDLKGSTVVPGMADAHQHLPGVGFREMTLNLEGVISLEDFLAKVKVRVDQAQIGRASCRERV